MNFFSRRTILAMIGISPASTAESAGQAVLVTSRRPDDWADTVTNRAALAALDARPGYTRLLDDGGRSGQWVWCDGDHRAAVEADPLQGLTIAHRTRSPSRGAWVRVWDGIHGKPEWFGARTDRPNFDNRTSIQAALDLCPTVQLAPGIYYVSGRLQIRRSSTRLVGAGISQTDQGANGNASQIVCLSADATILQIGADDARQPRALVEGVRLADFTVRRGVPPRTPDQGIGGAIGIAMRWCVNCHVERVFSLESARGWFFYGTVENYVKYCSALRARAGANPANDLFIGFHLDYSAPLAAVGGNASLYIDHCRAFGGMGDGTRPALAYSAGLRTDGGWVDLYIHALETGLIQYGIDGHGDAYDGGTSYRTEDLIVTNCVLDPGEIACIRLQSADTSAAVQISNCYMATIPSGTSLVLRDLGGSVTVASNQFITGTPGSAGLSAVNLNNLRAIGNIHTRIRQPIRLEHVTSFDLQDTIHGLDVGNALPAITLVDCERGKVDCIVNGRPSSFSTGVALQGSTTLVEIACTNLQAGAFPPGAAKIMAQSTPVRTAGPFVNNNLAQGIMA